MTNILPDLTNTFEGSSGQPFASIKLTLEHPDDYDRGITGRLIHRTKMIQRWTINIKYNPMTRVQFSPIYNFLMRRYGSLEPFYVSLPQYKESQSLAEGIADIGLYDAIYAGNGFVPMVHTGVMPSLGDMFNIIDNTNTLHTEAYMVGRVDTPANFLSVQPAAGNVNVHCIPRIQNITHLDSLVRFSNPMFYVTQTQDIQEYSLGNNNLYSFSLRLQEASY